MKCQKCGKDHANTHVKTIINGDYKEYVLCADCAKEMGYGNIFGNMQQEFSNMLGSFFGNTLPAVSQATHCPSCGSTYYDIADSGKVGCADCYSTFYDLLLPSIRRMHGNTTHCGKKSVAGIEYTETQPKKVSKLENLKAELDKAVKAQNFEEAAKLRDEIKELEKNNG
ncbi:MAG: UvrB/UvrC motif-containing protein [Ruminococcus sp.]|nr:UvrB/UvrC motif-containing protein [Ruminococcus sp.]